MATGKNRHSERGMAMVLTMIMIVIVLGAVLLVSRQAITAKTQTDIAHNQYQLEEACKAGIDTAIERVWNRYIASSTTDKTAGVAGNYATYLNFINGVVAKNAAPVYLVSPSNPLVLDETRGIRVNSVTLARTDNINGFNLMINATAQVGTQSRTAQQSVMVGGSPFVGFDYAVLANNISCILCHAEFTNVFLDTNTVAANRETFDRVKLASLENLMYRPSSDIADSNVAGTIYTRGNVINSYTRAAMSNAEITNINALASYPFYPPGDPKEYKIKQPTGSLNTMLSHEALSVAGVDGAGLPVKGGKMYKSYPTEVKKMADGLLPELFPAPFPDANENKVVDTSEFHTISDLLEGSVTGGVAFGVAAGGTYTGPSFPTASNGAAGDLASSGQYLGNLILTGTAANPIQLNGQIAVEGDLMLRGVVKGTGQLFVKGNTYIGGDVTYANGVVNSKETYGVAQDGTKNALAVITGGSVVMGDYQTIRGVNPSNDTANTPTSSYSIQTRLANKTASVTVNTTTETMRYGYKDTDPATGLLLTTDGNGIVPSRGASQQASFTQSELMLFNNLEMAKAIASSAYKPRFYGLDGLLPADRDKIYLYDNASSEHAIRYDEGGVNATTGGSSTVVLTLENYLTKKGITGDKATQIRNGARLFLRPDQAWLPDSVLRQMWWDDEQSRTAKGQIYKFDGLLYSNNSIFTIARSFVRHGSNSEGKMRIRGAIICPDIGVLAAGTSAIGNKSLQLQYDSRVKDFWAPQDRTTVTFTRRVYDLLAQAN